MKTMRKVFALLIALVMVIGMSMVVSAAGTGSITITPPTGLQSTDTTTYKIYKVFDATVSADGNNISYKLCAGDTLSAAMIAAGFSVDAGGNVVMSGNDAELSEAAIAAIAAYVTDTDLVKTVTATGTTAAVAEGLAYGYYYITTTVGTVVTIDSTKPNAEVNDKNTIPEIDKTITGASSYDEDGKKALAQIGTKVEYEVEITVGAGAKGYVFHDVMDSRLSYNNDVAVSPAAAVDNTTTASGDTITVTFKDSWLASAAEGTTITITYSATITDAALNDNPAKNTASLDFGDGYTTVEVGTEVYNAQFSVIKQDGDKQPLKGAGFVIKNADNKYYKLDSGVVTWVDAIADADEHISADDGKVAAFIGLANGTYTLVEKTVPDGYNRAADSTFTIAEHDYTAKNLKQEATVINNAGTELPATGGIGTTIFYVVGGLLIAAAGILLITKKRMSREN